jgi:glycosyltransferase involved in cell wall biosynthesis
LSKKFSVLLSIYHEENSTYFNKSLSSLYNQVLLPSEVVLVLDGALTTELYTVISEWEKRLPIKKVILKKNMGLSKALNAGLLECTYSLVARMDTDDISLSDRFSKQVEYMNVNPEVSICGTQAFDIDENDIILAKRTVPTEGDVIKKVIWSCPLIHPSVMFRKEDIIGVGSYNVNAPHRQDDYELWIRCISNGLVINNLSDVLIHYRFPIGSYRKNTVKVALNRFKLGIVPALKYDFGIMSIFGLIYPLIRAVSPSFILPILISLANKSDPRKK